MRAATVLNAREVFLAAYPPWDRQVLAFTALTHGVLGEGLQGDQWVVTADQLGVAIGPFLRLPDEMEYRRWEDLSRFLRANRSTQRDKLRFLRDEVLHPKNFSRSQLIGMGAAVGAGFPLVIGSGLAWCLVSLFKVSAWLSVAHGAVH